MDHFHCKKNFFWLAFFEKNMGHKRSSIVIAPKVILLFARWRKPSKWKVTNHGEGNLRHGFPQFPITADQGTRSPKWSATRRVCHSFSWLNPAKFVHLEFILIDRDQRRCETINSRLYVGSAPTKVQELQNKAECERWLA